MTRLLRFGLLGITLATYHIIILIACIVIYLDAVSQFRITASLYYYDVISNLLLWQTR